MIYEPPQWLFWLLLSLGLTIAIILAYHEVRMQKLNLEHRLDDKAKKRETREKLGEFLEQGQTLKRKCANEKDPPPDEEADTWASEVESYLSDELDDSYISRFRSSAGVPLTANSISSIPHRNLWAGIHTRLYQLEKFIEQLRD